MLSIIPKKTNNDGTIECAYKYDQEFINFYKKETGAQVVRKSNVGKFIVKMLTELVDTTPNKSK